MRYLGLALLAIVLAGCAVGVKKKHDNDIYREAMQLGVESSDDAQLQLITIKIPSHGLLADQATIRLGGGANTGLLREVLQGMKGERGKALLVIGGNPSLDYAVISNAVTGLQLEGVRFIFSGKPSQKAELENIVKATGASFQFIDMQG